MTCDRKENDGESFCGNPTDFNLHITLDLFRKALFISKEEMKNAGFILCTRKVQFCCPQKNKNKTNDSESHSKPSHVFIPVIGESIEYPKDITNVRHYAKYKELNCFLGTYIATRNANTEQV